MIMNILPHKSWHVRTKKSIARFKRDEEKASTAEDGKTKRIKLAESEARINQLRHKIAHSPKATTTDTGGAEVFNLFANFEDSRVDDAEQKKEKAVAQEKWEVGAGIFSYLDGRYRHDDEAVDDQWYTKSHEDRMKLNQHNITAKAIQDDKIKSVYDPLNVIKFYQTKLTKKHDQPSTSQSIKQENGDHEMTKETLGKLYEIEKAKKLKKKSKKSKKTKKHKRHRSKSDSEDDQAVAIKSKLINKLKQERLEREQAERAKTKRLLGGEETSEPTTQRFHSQFNPHLAKQNRNR